MRCFPKRRGFSAGLFAPRTGREPPQGGSVSNLAAFPRGMPRAADGSRRRVACVSNLAALPRGMPRAPDGSRRRGGRASAGLSPRAADGCRRRVACGFCGVQVRRHRGGSVSLFRFSYAHLLACCWGLSPPKCLAVPGRAFFRRHAFCAYGCASTADVDDGLRVVFPFGIECEGVH